MAFSRPDLKTLISRIVGDIETSIDQTIPLLPKAVLRVLGKVKAGAVHGLYGFGVWLARQIFPDTAEREYLERWASIWGIFRKPPTYANGPSTISGGTPGAAVPDGTLYLGPNGIEYETDGGIFLDGTGAGTISVVALTSGSLGNLANGIELSIVNPVAGVPNKTTASGDGIRNGNDEETDDSLRTRLLQRIQTPPQGGAKTDYIAWALAVAGVTRAWCYPLYAGEGTVGVTFVLDDDPSSIIPPPSKVSEVRAYIEERMPVTVNPVDGLFVFAPIEKPINFTIDLIPDTPEVRSAVTAELADFIKRKGAPDTTIPISQFDEVISGSDGETDHNMTVPSGPVVIAKTEIGVLGTITWL